MSRLPCRSIHCAAYQKAICHLFSLQFCKQYTTDGAETVKQKYANKLSQ